MGISKYYGKQMKLAWQQIPSTVISDILCQNDLDGVVLDSAHSCYNKETLYSCIQVVSLNNKKCFVRLGKQDKFMAKYCLDAGAAGIIFSTVEHKSEVEEIHKLCKYPKSMSNYLSTTNRDPYDFSYFLGLGLHLLNH